MACLPAAVCSLPRSLSYIFLQINYSQIFNLILSAHLFCLFRGPSICVSLFSAPLLVSSTTLISHGSYLSFTVALQMPIPNVIYPALCLIETFSNPPVTSAYVSSPFPPIYLFLSATGYLFITRTACGGAVWSAVTEKQVGQANSQRSALNQTHAHAPA